MTDAADGSHRSSLVWTEATARAAAIMALDDAAFDAEMRRRFGDGYGEAHVTGPRWSYPLTFLHAERYVGQIGRAHVCTPVTNAHLVCSLLLEKKNHITTARLYSNHYRQV